MMALYIFKKVVRSNMMEYDCLQVMVCNNSNEPTKNNIPVPRGSNNKNDYDWINLLTSDGRAIAFHSRETTNHKDGKWLGGYTATFRIAPEYFIPWAENQVNVWRNTRDDHDRLIITNNDVVGAPKPKTYFVNIPGSNRILDLSSYIMDKPTYEQRTLTFEFAIELDPDECMRRYSYLLMMYHGQRIQIMLDYDDSDIFQADGAWDSEETESTTHHCHWFYEGRANIGQMKRKLSLCTFTMTVECDPYKYAYDLDSGKINRSLTRL